MRTKGRPVGRLKGRLVGRLPNCGAPAARQAQQKRRKRTENTFIARGSEAQRSEAEE